MPKLSPQQIIRKPIVTEKGQWDSERNRSYHFMVHVRANKVQIQKAVEALFKVTVVDVRTQIRPGKVRRFGMVTGAKPPWKKAVVKVQEGDMIEFV